MAKTPTAEKMMIAWPTGGRWRNRVMAMPVMPSMSGGLLKVGAGAGPAAGAATSAPAAETLGLGPAAIDAGLAGRHRPGAAVQLDRAGAADPLGQADVGVG